MELEEIKAMFGCTCLPKNQILDPHVQGGPSGCALCFVDIKLRVVLENKDAILWQNFRFANNKRQCTIC